MGHGARRVWRQFTSICLQTSKANPPMGRDEIVLAGVKYLDRHVASLLAMTKAVGWFGVLEKREVRNFLSSKRRSFRLRERSMVICF